jgi:hypothetical protein
MLEYWSDGIMGLGQMGERLTGKIPIEWKLEEVRGG